MVVIFWESAVTKTLWKWAKKIWNAQKQPDFVFWDDLNVILKISFEIILSRSRFLKAATVLEIK